MRQQHCGGTKYRILGMAALVGGAALLRAVSVHLDIPLRDEMLYMREVAAMLRDGGIAEDNVLNNFPPLLVLIMTLAPIFNCSLNSFSLGFVIITSSLAIPAVYLLARRVFYRESFAWMAAVLAALLPISVDIGSSVMRDQPYLAAVLWAAYGVLKALDSERLTHWLGWCSFTGLATGAALSLRWEGLMIFCGALLCLGVLRDRSGGFSIKRRAAGAAAMVLAALVIFLAVRAWFAQWGAPFWPKLGNTRINDIWEADDDV